MKLYRVTYKHPDTSDRTFVFAQVGNRFSGMQLSVQAVSKFLTERPEIRYSDWDYLPTSFYDITSLDDLKRRVQEYPERAYREPDMVSYTLEEIVGEVRSWFFGWGIEFTLRLVAYLSDKFSGDKRVRLHRISSSMQDRSYFMYHGRPRQDPRAYIKGDSYTYAHGYRNARDFCKEMGNAIAQSITLEEDAFSELFMYGYDQGTLHFRIAEHAQRVLTAKGIDFDLAMQDCGHWEHHGNEVQVINGRGRWRDYCQACATDTDIVIETHDTGVLMLRDDAYWDDYNEAYCQHEPEREDDEDEDDEDNDPDRLLSYSTNALDYLSKDDSFNTSAFGEFHMGIELELVTSGYTDSAVRDLRSKLGADYCICKSDGSLPSGGVEVVTAPRGLTQHISKFKNWQVDSRYTAWNTNRCGMHIHIDSRAFTQLTLGKFIMFINNDDNKDFIRKIAGRHPAVDSQAQSYCAAEGQQILANPSKALKGKSPNRYYMVNTTCLNKTEASRLGVSYVGERRFNTIELRIFRATLKKERLLAQIEFTHAVIMFCRVASMRDMNAPAFLKWLKATDNRYPHLADWYGIRRREGAKNSAPAESACADAVQSV
jgi:hypothetical protein